MSMVHSFIYRQGLDTGPGSKPWRKFKAKFFRFIRQCALRLADPICKMEIWGRSMWIPFSHELPGCLIRPWHYDQALQRIADHIRSTRGPVCGIDVGANIGDTIAAILKDEKDKFLAIEPNPIYFNCLNRNLGGEPNVQLLNLVCSTSDDSTEYRVTTLRGTARFEQSRHGGQRFETRSLDTIVAHNQNFSGCNFLKIDTDGHDFEVLRGARRLIASTKPAVLFECEPGDNSAYVEDVFDTFKFFAGLGYELAIIYDNDGELFGVLDLNNPSSFAQALFYQLTSRKCNFDVLIMPDATAFLHKELAFFVNATGNVEFRTAAQNAAKHIQASKC